MSVYVSTEEFGRAATVFAALIDAGACEAIALAPAYDQLVCLYVDRQHAQLNTILDGFGATLDDLGEAQTDLQDAIGALMAEAGPDGFATARSDPRPLMDETEEPETAHEKYQLAERAFDVASLRRQFQFKLASKNPLLWTMEWELLHKLDDDDYGPTEDPLPFATFRLVTRPPVDRQDEPRNDIVLCMDQADVRFAIRVLKRLDDAFTAQAGGL
jgi:hypothetical protein